MSKAEDFRNHINEGYTFEGDFIAFGSAILEGGPVGEANVKIPLSTLNRHGLIAGATGTGKTKSLQVLADERALKGIPIHLKLKHPTYHINWEEVREKVTAKTKLIITNNPHNPFGSAWTEDEIKALEELVQAHPELMVLIDEVYEYIQYNNEHQSVLKSSILGERSFITYSFGKTMHVTGWKLGYCIAPESFTAEYRKIHQYMAFCANNTMQYAVAKYLNTGEFWREVMPMYQQKKDLFMEQIKMSRFKTLTRSGTYFFLLDYSEISTLSDVDFAKELTIKYGVAAIPVSVFYQDQTDHKVIRICFAKQNETLIKAAELL